MKKKPTVKNIAEYYGKSKTTIQNWKKTNLRIYGALKRDFIKVYG